MLQCHLGSPGAGRLPDSAGQLPHVPPLTEGELFNYIKFLSLVFLLNYMQRAESA